MFCIPKHLIKRLKDSALSKQVDISKLYEMTTEQRNAFFAKFSNAEIGKFVNTRFEKAIVSKKKDALLDWAKSIYDPKTKKVEFEALTDKIKSLDEQGILNPKTEEAFLKDLVEDKLGIRVTPEEVAQIDKRAKEIQKTQKALGDELGNPNKLQENVDFFKAQKEMDDYMKSLQPSSKLKILTGTIGRGMLLFNIKSPTLNIGSNFLIGAAEALSRRIANRSIKTTNNKLGSNFVKMANEIYNKTGYDISRMVNVKDIERGSKAVDEVVHTQGTGTIRKIGRVVEDIVFSKLMGKPDVMFATRHYADSVNLNALKIAKGDKNLANEFMEDAMRLDPKTSEGALLREQGVFDAEVATWTNKSWTSNVSLKIRDALNNIYPDGRFGDLVMPFVKTPANVIATGLDYAGGGAVKAIWKTAKMFKDKDFSKERITDMSRDLIRSGLGFTGALIIASQLDTNDFVGAYDPSRSQIEGLRNANYNAIRLGGKWISVDWLGPLAIPTTAIMYARKYGDKPKDKFFQYGKGMVTQAGNIPGFQQVADIYSGLTSSNKKAGIEEATQSVIKGATDFLYSRLIPSFITDIGNATDSVKRKATNTFETIKSKIPGLRQTLPSKKDVFGQDIKTEGFFESIFFGARVKANREDATIKELVNLIDEGGKNITFTDWDNSASKQLAEFKIKVGPDKFEKAKVEYGQELKKELDAFISSSKYKGLGISDKLKEISSLDTSVIKKITKKYGYKYK